MKSSTSLVIIRCFRVRVAVLSISVSAIFANLWN
jgi:hypothetical protein